MNWGRCEDVQLNLPPQNPETSTERNTGLPARPGAPFGFEGQEPEQEVSRRRGHSRTAAEAGGGGQEEEMQEHGWAQQAEQGTKREGSNPIAIAIGRRKEEGGRHSRWFRYPRLPGQQQRQRPSGSGSGGNRTRRTTAASAPLSTAAESRGQDGTGEALSVYKWGKAKAERQAASLTPRKRLAASC